MTWNRLAWWVLAGVATAGCGSSGSPAQRLIEARNDLTREECACFHEDLGYSSARECREEETIPRPPQHECEERAYGADETGVVRESTLCQISVYEAQADCYGSTGCDEEALADCDSEAFDALAECPVPTAEAMEAFQTELQACLTDTPPAEQCPDDSAGSVTGAPALTGSTEGSDDDLSGSCGGDGEADEALEWVAPQSGIVTIDTFGSEFDTVLYVLEGTCGGTELACNDDTSGFQSQVTIEVTQGETYVIVVDAWGFEEGDFQLNILYDE
ncbi:MAG: hypothetical protein ACODAU_12585 [Myxococcota bacterium]